jgi:hypothetical protein
VLCEPERFCQGIASPVGIATPCPQVRPLGQGTPWPEYPDQREANDHLDHNEHNVHRGPIPARGATKPGRNIGVPL